MQNHFHLLVTNVRNQTLFEPTPIIERVRVKKLCILCSTYNSGEEIQKKIHHDQSHELNKAYLNIPLLITKHKRKAVHFKC